MARLPWTLQPVDATNFHAVIDLDVRDGQRDFVASNLYSIAESAVEPSFVPLAIYAGDEVVGFTVYGQEPGTERWWGIRLMIDTKHQGRGYGRAAMRALSDLMVERHGTDEVVTSYHPDNAAARLYERLGFRPTGEIEDGELVVVLPVRG